MHEVFGDERFQRLADIPNGHIYNLRKTRSYRTGRLSFRKTCPTTVPVGVRRADNGSEYINSEVADLLNRLHIPTFTKSRPRRSNDNALVESNNGSIVRRWLGHVHIPHELVPQLNDFLLDSPSPLLNFHRPCLFPKLDRLASATPDLGAAKAVQRARHALFHAIGQARDSAA